MKYFDFCKNVALEKLDEYVGNNTYLCDLDYMLTDYENVNGSWYCSEHKAKKDVQEWFEDLGDFVEYYKDNFGDNKNLNVLGNVEGFHCLAVICGVADIVQSALSKMNVDGDEEVELTPQLVSAIKKNVARVREFSWS